MRSPPRRSVQRSSSTTRSTARGSAIAAIYHSRRAVTRSRIRRRASEALPTAPARRGAASRGSRSAPRAPGRTRRSTSRTTPRLSITNSVGRAATEYARDVSAFASTATAYFIPVRSAKTRRLVRGLGGDPDHAQPLRTVPRLQPLSFGASTRQAPHHVAQKSSSTTRPRSDAIDAGARSDRLHADPRRRERSDAIHAEHLVATCGRSPSAIFTVMAFERRARPSRCTSFPGACPDTMRVTSSADAHARAVDRRDRVPVFQPRLLRRRSPNDVAHAHAPVTRRGLHRDPQPAPAGKRARHRIARARRDRSRHRQDRDQRSDDGARARQAPGGDHRQLLAPQKPRGASPPSPRRGHARHAEKLLVSSNRRRPQR